MEIPEQEFFNMDVSFHFHFKISLSKWAVSPHVCKMFLKYTLSCRCPLCSVQIFVDGGESGGGGVNLQ